MSDIKSPFLIYQNFISPLMCDKITSNYAQIIEDDGLCILKPQVNLSTIITEKINEIIHDIMTYYDTNILDITIPTLYELKQGANN